jgi:hypothetical protein
VIQRRPNSIAIIAKSPLYDLAGQRGCQPYLDKPLDRFEYVAARLPPTVPTVPSAGRGCLSALASVVHLILTAIATRARQVSETV